MRFVFDTNVLVSALLISDSEPAKALKLAEDNGIVLYSKPVLEELGAVLSRPKFSRYISGDDITGFLARIHRAWQEVHIIHAVKACRDPADDKFLDVAVNGKATYIVTGDRDLLELNPFQKIRIVTPAEFFDVS